MYVIGWYEISNIFSYISVPHLSNVHECFDYILSFSLTFSDNEILFMLLMQHTQYELMYWSIYKTPILTNCNMNTSSNGYIRATWFPSMASFLFLSNQYRVFIIYNTQRVPNLQYQLSNIWPSISLMKFCRGVQNKEVHHNKNGNKVMSIFQFLFVHFYSYNKAFIVVNHNHSLISFWSDITSRYRIMVHTNRVHFTLTQYLCNTNILIYIWRTY